MPEPGEPVALPTHAPARASARGVAVEILRRVESDAAYPDPLLEHLPTRAGLEPRDRALTTELVYGSLRWQRLLDWQLERVSHRSIAELPAWLRALLRAGAYQLAFLDRIPPWAVVHEAVELAKGRRPRGIPRFVNALLRALAAQPRPWPEPTAGTVGDPLEALAVRTSQPTWLIRRWVARYGEGEAATLARAMNERPPLVARVNTLRATPEALAEALRNHGARVEPCRYAPDGLMVAGAGDPRDLAPLRAGWCAVQDEAAILVGHVVAPEPGETVADVCAAPGTKTTHLAELMQNHGRILATDRHAGRVERLSAACRLMGATIVEARVGSVEALAREVGAICDRVLVDAPCSNLGVLRRNPDGKWRRHEADLLALAANQGAILDAAAALVRPGGVLVYATCSLEPDENEAVLAAFGARWPVFVPDPIPAAVPRACLATPEMLRMFPHRHGTDGFTALRLRRRA
ncbi:MAG: 16S rRNA (cytosine(967)-C(5))-methyltransferase RsmB [Candidatus Rokubacteria bacterium]|nr:16S rRNA (cytosine(967)-C(5))-methyltransferase RsmB [Candidatus Rokubacteria bacterium]